MQCPECPMGQTRMGSHGVEGGYGDGAVDFVVADSAGTGGDS